MYPYQPPLQKQRASLSSGSQPDASAGHDAAAADAAPTVPPYRYASKIPAPQQSYYYPQHSPGSYYYPTDNMPQATGSQQTGSDNPGMGANAYLGPPVYSNSMYLNPVYSQQMGAGQPSPPYPYQYRNNGYMAMAQQGAPGAGSAGRVTSPPLAVVTDPSGQTVPPGIKPKVTTTIWEDEGTTCFQVEARGVCVARREDNDFINGTKLLNVAGMTRGRRDGLLKGERNRHVVKAGAMHLKGVWIPYQRALDFANKEKITDFLYPLFVTDIKSVLFNPTEHGRSNTRSGASRSTPGPPQERVSPSQGSPTSGSPQQLAHPTAGALERTHAGLTPRLTHDAQQDSPQGQHATLHQHPIQHMPQQHKSKHQPGQPHAALQSHRSPLQSQLLDPNQGPYQGLPPRVQHQGLQHPHPHSQHPQYLQHPEHPEHPEHPVPPQGQQLPYQPQFPSKPPQIQTPPLSHALPFERPSSLSHEPPAKPPDRGDPHQDRRDFFPQSSQYCYTGADGYRYDDPQPQYYPGQAGPAVPALDGKMVPGSMPGTGYANHKAGP